MDIKIKELFIKEWKTYFNNSDLPITFYYTNDPQDSVVVEPPGKRSCLICELKRVRNGESLAFSSAATPCFGAKRYLGVTGKMRLNFEYFLSCGIKDEMEGERYIRTPEMVKELMKNQKKLNITGRYIVFKRWDMLVESDNPEVVIFFATPDILSGLFTLANYDQTEPNGTFTPFGAGCGSIVHYPYLEKDSERPRAVIGMFDVSARPCVPAGILTFSVPMIKFLKMISYMNESFLITDSWREVRNRLK